MDFNDTPEEARFREEAVTWLNNNVPTDEAFWALTPLEQAKLWQKRKYDDGWACLGWAPEFGGRGASPHHHAGHTAQSTGPVRREGVNACPYHSAYGMVR